MKDPFTYFLRVRYSECDAQKVVFNARYVEYMDIAVAEFIRVVWGTYDVLSANGIEISVVGLKVDWKAPARYDDVLAITVSPVRIGVSSYTLQVVFYNHATVNVIATGEITYVMVSADRYEKMDIPPDMRTQFERGAAGITVDHADAIVRT